MASPNTPWSATPCSDFTPLQRRWLIRPGSLTETLRAEGRFTLRVLREGTEELSAQESGLLGEAVGARIWLREVVMAVNGVDSVFARSFALLADTGPQGAWEAVCALRSNPLRDILYDDPKISRSPFRVARLSGEDPAYESLRRAMPESCPPAHDFLSRYSVFTREGRPFLVMECFFPNFWETVSARCYSPHGACGTSIHAPATACSTQRVLPC